MAETPDHDLRALEANFSQWSTERAPGLQPSDAFERYTVDQILKDADLSDEEIASGIIGGGDDGGVDAMYLFMNDVLVQEGTVVPQPIRDVELVIIQAKLTKGFDETAVQKLGDFVDDLFNWKKPIKDLTYLSSVAKDAVERFRTNYDAALGTAQSFKVDLHFATKSQTDPNTKVRARAKNVTDHIRRQATNAVADFEFWKASRLLQSARATPQIDILIPLAQHFSTDDGSLVGLVTLPHFAELLTNPDKSLRTAILEPNVRDYQGKGNKVNADIRATLLEADPKEDFWWLNNGVTILAQACSVSGNKLKITKPEVVNGLQTSHEVFNAFSGGATNGGDRKILLRVITPKEEKSRNNIIKATNSQTTVSPVSLRATDKIHFDIEDRLKLYDVFYDLGLVREQALEKPLELWLTDPSPAVRGSATVLLADFPDMATHDRLNTLAADPDPAVRASAARSIGFAQQTAEADLLSKLLGDQDAKVRRAAMMSLLSFSPKDDSVAAIFKANLNNQEFTPLFLLALARENPAPYLDGLVKEMEQNAVPANWAGGETPWFAARQILFKYLQAQPFEQVTSGKLDRYLNAIDKAALNTNGVPIYIYAFYVQRGMTERAKTFRQTAKKAFPYLPDASFDQVDKNPLLYKGASDG
jgi:hypothetical protein